MVDAVFKRKPMQFSENWRDVVSFHTFHDSFIRCILYCLQTFNLVLGQASKKTSRRLQQSSFDRINEKQCCLRLCECGMNGLFSRIEHDISRILQQMKHSQLVSWYFEPSQPQRVTSWLKNNVQSGSYLLCTQVIKPQIIHKPQNQS